MPFSVLNMLIWGSSPYASTLFVFLCRAKKRKKYTSIFTRFRALKTKNRAPEKSIDRSEALFCLILPDFCPKCRKNAFCRGRQKTFLLWRRVRDSNPRYFRTQHFECCTFDHSDNSPFPCAKRFYQKNK